MACLQELQDDVAEILAIMQLGNPCCDDMDITDGNQYTDRVEDGVGNVPQNIIDAGYASGTSDWAGFDDYKCMIVHVTVNQMSARLNELNELVNEYGAIAGSAAAIAAIMAVIFATGGVAIVFGIIAGVGAVSLLYESLMGFPLLGNLADKVDTNHLEIACAMYDSDGDAGALVALNDKIDELFTVAEAVILKNLNNGPTLKALYSGRYDQQDIAEILEAAGYDLLDFDCTCDIPVGEYWLSYDFEDAVQGDWKVDGSVGFDTPGRLDTYGVGLYATGKLYHSTTSMRDYLGIPTPDGKTFLIHRISFWYRSNHTAALRMRLQLLNTESGDHYFNYVNTPTWTYVLEEFDPPIEIISPADRIIQFLMEGVASFQRMDDLIIDCDIEG